LASDTDTLRSNAPAARQLQIPRAVTVAPPFDATFPPFTALVAVMLVTADVLTVAVVLGNVVKRKSAP
jgi:hypothetical protein